MLQALGKAIDSGSVSLKHFPCMFLSFISFLHSLSILFLIDTSPVRNDRQSYYGLSIVSFSGFQREIKVDGKHKIITDNKF